MNKKIGLLVFSLIFTVTPYLLMPAIAQADGCQVIDQNLGTYDVSVPALPRYCSVGEVVRRILTLAFVLIGGVSLLFMIIGGFRYMTAGGNEEQATSGKKTVLYAVLGLVVVIMAVTVVNVVVNLLLYGKTF